MGLVSEHLGGGGVVSISPLLGPAPPTYALAEGAVPHAFPARALARSGLPLVPHVWVSPAFKAWLKCHLPLGDSPIPSSWDGGGGSSSISEFP